MIKNYFKTAFRSLLKNKFYSAINIIGLAIGLATCLLILLYVTDELSYDRYNANADNIYRINNELKFGGNHLDLAVAAAPMGAAVVREFPQVKQFTRVQWYGSFRVKKGNENLLESRVAYADSTLFEVFTFSMLEGDPRTALTEPNSLVITESIAKKYFNSTDIVGKNLLIDNTRNYKITGVIKNIPQQSHFNFDFLIPMLESEESRTDDWLSSQNHNTYILLQPGTDSKKLETELNKMMERYTAPQLKSLVNQSLEEFKHNGGFVGASLTPLTDIHLHSNKIGELGGNGSIQFVYIFSAIGLLIMLIACANFMNLSTARSSNRAMEVGIRKVLGSLRRNLIAQFLSESFLISFIALTFSLTITWLLIPYFNQLSGKSIDANTLLRPSMLLSIALLIVMVGICAGSYPAFFLSSFKPVNVLKGKLATGFKRSWLRNALVTFQFVISIALIVGTLVIYNQLNYIRTKNIGFDRNRVLTIQHTDVLKDHGVTFRNELLKISGVENATMTGFLPTNSYRRSTTFFTSPTLDTKTAMNGQQWRVDENYIPTLAIQFLKGRNFSPDFPTDSMGIIVNEAAANFLGAGDILNKKLYNVANSETMEAAEYHIIGVIKNFNFSSLRNVIAPLALKLQADNTNISVSVSSTNIPAVLAQIKNKWASMVPDEPFDYSFMDEQFDNLYTAEQRTGQIFITFAIAAIFIGCLGLFGLVTYAAEQRMKEIGIRKVLGASAITIVAMISKDFLKLVIIAAAIALPVAWWAMNKWLEDFAYRTNISWWVFLAAGLTALMIALVTISFQSIKAAIMNPVKSLRTE